MAKIQVNHNKCGVALYAGLACVVIASGFLSGCPTSHQDVAYSVAALARTFNRAEISYASAHPELGFACDLSPLAAEGLIDQNLASGRAAGYVFAITSCKQQSRLNVGYIGVASPESLGRTGAAFFCGDESGTVKLSLKDSTDCIRAGRRMQ